MTNDTAVRRRTVREQLRLSRRKISAPQRIAGAEALAAQLLALPLAPQSGYMAGYWAMDGEIALHAWQLKLPERCVYCLPVLVADTGLMFAPWRSGDALVTNRFGIPEPDLCTGSLLAADQMAMVVLPLVGFDRRGHRLGMGGGWYDRSFAFRQQRPAPPLLVGAAFEVQRVEALDPQPWDVALDAVCTEGTTHHCRRPTE